jgi:hypothetical protein
MNKMKKPNPTTRRISLQVFVAVSFMLTACEREKPAGSSAKNFPEALAGTIVREEPPQPAQSFAEVRKKVGQPAEVVLTGRVGGRLDPFIAGYAAFVLTGEEVEFCDEMGDDDHCQTPWDACCEDPEHIAAHRALVQIADSTGQPLPIDLKSGGWLSENQSLTIAGTLDPQATADNLIVNVSRIYLPEAKAP